MNVTPNQYLTSSPGFFLDSFKVVDSLDFLNCRTLCKMQVLLSNFRFTFTACFHYKSTFYNVTFLVSGITQYLDPPSCLVLQYL